MRKREVVHGEIVLITCYYFVVLVLQLYIHVLGLYAVVLRHYIILNIRQY